jgi:hypothetical protein
MCRVTRCTRSTAPSKAWRPNARPRCRCQAPPPRSGVPLAPGLIAALWPQHNPSCRRSLPAALLTTHNISTGAVAFVAPQLQSRISTSLTDVTQAGPRAGGGRRLEAYQPATLACGARPHPLPPPQQHRASAACPDTGHPGSLRRCRGPVSAGAGTLATASRPVLGAARCYKSCSDASRSGPCAEALALLQPVYDRVTEGFDTEDLKAAKALLDALE